MLNFQGDRFDGDFMNGYMHGKGIFHFENGDNYEGDWIKGA